jgi:hypothetical protein
VHNIISISNNLNNHIVIIEKMIFLIAGYDNNVVLLLEMKKEKVDEFFNSKEDKLWSPSLF